MDNSRYKFRAWDKENKRMVPVDEIKFSLNGEVKGIKWTVSEIENRVVLKENLILMQFTGLTDSEGKEIYEGDVCVCPATYPFFDGEERNYVGIIEWVQCNCAFELILKCVNPNKRGISDGINQSLSYFENIKIIGNIYEEKFGWALWQVWKEEDEIRNDKG